MDIKELRIGNYIASSGNKSNIETWVIGEVLEIGNEDSEFEQVYCECEESFEWFFKDNYFGIPLTEEILLRLGFGKNGEAPSRLGLSCEFGDVMIDFKNSKCKYVHQLQNLYFALTGEELTLK